MPNKTKKYKSKSKNVSRKFRNASSKNKLQIGGHMVGHENYFKILDPENKKKYVPIWIIEQTNTSKANERYTVVPYKLNNDGKIDFDTNNKPRSRMDEQYQTQHKTWTNITNSQIKPLAPPDFENFGIPKPKNMQTSKSEPMLKETTEPKYVMAKKDGSTDWLPAKVITDKDEDGYSFVKFLKLNDDNKIVFDTNHNPIVSGLRRPQYRVCGLSYEMRGTSYRIGTFETLDLDHHEYRSD